MLQCDEFNLQLITSRSTKIRKGHKSHGVTSCEINSSRHNAMYINTLRTNVMSDEFLKKIIYC